MLEEHGLRHDSIVARMSGCPNSCSRPSLAELGFIGKAPGSYMMLLGGGHCGDRLSNIYRGKHALYDLYAPNSYRDQ